MEQVVTPELEQFLTQFPPSQQEALRHYEKLLREFNQRIHLVSRKDESRIFSYHIVPSLIALQLVSLPVGETVLDLGSGGGLPGIPWKIVRPDLEMILVDSVRKKTLFLKRVVRELGLGRCLVLNVRLNTEEAVRLNLIESVGMVTARAVGNLAMLWELGGPLLKKGGKLLAWKGSRDQQDFFDFQQQHHIPGKILTIPPYFHSLSPKLADLRLFMLQKP